MSSVGLATVPCSVDVGLGNLKSVVNKRCAAAICQIDAICAASRGIADQWLAASVRCGVQRSLDAEEFVFEGLRAHDFVVT